MIHTITESVQQPKNLCSHTPDTSNTNESAPTIDPEETESEYFDNLSDSSYNSDPNSDSNNDKENLHPNTISDNLPSKMVTRSQSKLVDSIFHTCNNVWGENNS